MGVIQPTASYRDSVREVALGRAGPYGFVVAIVAVTLGLYAGHGAPTSAEAIGLVIGGLAGLAAAAAAGLRRSSAASPNERLPETWLDLHPVAVLCSAGSGLAAAALISRAEVAWAAAAALTGFAYVLIAAAELSFRQRREAARQQALRAAAAPVEVADDFDPDEWRESRLATIASLVDLPSMDAGVGEPERQGDQEPLAPVATAEPVSVEEPAAVPEPEPVAAPTATADPVAAAEPASAEEPADVSEPVTLRVAFLPAAAPSSVEIAKQDRAAFRMTIPVAAPEPAAASATESVATRDAEAQPASVVVAAAAAPAAEKAPAGEAPEPEDVVSAGPRVRPGGPRPAGPRPARGLLQRHRKELLVVATVALAGAAYAAHRRSSRRRR